MAESTDKERARTSTAATPTPTQESTSTTVAEEIRKEFSQNNQHNLPRGKKEVEPIPRRTIRLPNKKQYQRSRGRNKR